MEVAQIKFLGCKVHTQINEINRMKKFLLSVLYIFHQNVECHSVHEGCLLSLSVAQVGSLITGGLLLGLGPPRISAWQQRKPETLSF